MGFGNENVGGLGGHRKSSKPGCKTSSSSRMPWLRLRYPCKSLACQPSARAGGAGVNFLLCNARYHRSCGRTVPGDHNMRGCRHRTRCEHGKSGMHACDRCAVHEPAGEAAGIHNWVGTQRKKVDIAAPRSSCTIPACCTATRMRCTACMQRTRTYRCGLSGAWQKATPNYMGVWQGGHARCGGVGTQRQRNMCEKINKYIYTTVREFLARCMWYGVAMRAWGGAGHRRATISREFLARCMWYGVAMRAWGGAGHRSAKIS